MFYCGAATLPSKKNRREPGFYKNFTTFEPENKGKAYGSGQRDSNRDRRKVIQVQV
jgi:hypothetical protein